MRDSAVPEPAVPGADAPGARSPVADGAPGSGGPADPGALTALQLLRHLDSGPRGLTEAQAEERLLQYGENAVPEWRTASWPRRFLWSLRDPFTAVLLCLGLVSATVAAWGTALVILSLVAVSCLLRSSGEHRADRSMAGLRELVATTATVLRREEARDTPETREIPVDQLVPGDVIRLGPGDLVPADVRLLRASGLTVHQAPLTGESAPVAKYAVDGPGLPEPGPVVPVGDYAGVFAQPHLCFQGSSVASGSGTAVVVATGARTRFGAARRRPGRRSPSAFDRSVNGISWVLIRFMLLTPPLVLMANAALRGRGLETLPFAVAVAVGLTPEMLPVIVTTALARGAARLARAHSVIVKRLPALHDLGAVDVLFLDKTGTLTQDRPVVARAMDAYGAADPEVLRWAAVNAWWTLQLADLPVPDALDEAILGAVGEDAAAEGADGVAALPFDPVRRLSTAVVRRPGRLGTHTLVVKGAVTDVLERCALDDDERARLTALAAREADSGLRLLAVARAERPARQRDYTPADEYGLDFLGFVTLRDALAPTAADALKVFADRGVTVKILTGDHPGTAARACLDLGLGPGEVVTADRIDALSDAELAELAGRTTVFARCAPEHKARIVAAVRAAGHTTGFLGDGVNDLPALYAADVGICPRDAVDVVRESTDVVLAKKDLTAIDHAITAGRHSSGNIATYLRITLSSNLGNVIAMLVAGLLLPFLPMLPVQVLVQNLCFDAAQLAFAYDRPRPETLRRPSELRSRAFLRFITRFGLINASADLATFAVLAYALHTAAGSGLESEAAFHSGWFTENLLTQALVMLLLRTGVRGPALWGAGRRAGSERGAGSERRRAAGPVRWAAGGLAATGLLLPLSPLGPALGMPALPAQYYVLLAAVLGLYAVGLVVAKDRHERRHAALVAAGEADTATEAGTIVAGAAGAGAADVTGATGVSAASAASAAPDVPGAPDAPPLRAVQP
ncbi:magnesium-translocating P-type ATPase [Streptomyces paludis]|uniref:Magnesium-transporting ATPase, P-type 1 n=1 Tax=Streptomyces paludis TaxID=2282738 RepID=A0A345HPQ1_9ACTN|nr:magnesium-translocating P-type ATPase [Streptomyces paludis]AXG78675.1 magnesium-translocating P-type ATPase [Streptomyces paludis]